MCVANCQFWQNATQKCRLAIRSHRVRVRRDEFAIHFDRPLAGDPCPAYRPGGLGAVAAESLAIKHQLLIMKRARRRAPHLTSWDRLALGVCTLLVSPRRRRKMAVILKPSTLLYFHQALVKRK
jgi:hypothetical protein